MVSVHQAFADKSVVKRQVKQTLNEFCPPETIHKHIQMLAEGQQAVQFMGETLQGPVGLRRFNELQVSQITSKEAELWQSFEGDLANQVER